MLMQISITQPSAQRAHPHTNGASWMSLSNSALLATRVGATRRPADGLKRLGHVLGEGGATRALHQEGAEEMPTKAARRMGLVLSVPPGLGAWQFMH